MAISTTLLNELILESSNLLVSGKYNGVTIKWDWLDRVERVNEDIAIVKLSFNSTNKYIHCYEELTKNKVVCAYDNDPHQIYVDINFISITI